MVVQAVRMHADIAAASAMAFLMPVTIAVSRSIAPASSAYGAPRRSADARGSPVGEADVRQRGVLRCLQLRRDRYFVTRGIDRDQRAVVERVQVRAQQEAVSNVVGFRAQVAADVRRFENRFDRAVRERATALVRFEELLAERGLALPYDDRGECLLAGVFEIRWIECRHDFNGLFNSIDEWRVVF
ncbi:hypothetical protein PQR16_25805 [Caballeronia glebae]